MQESWWSCTGCWGGSHACLWGQMVSLVLLLYSADGTGIGHVHELAAALGLPLLVAAACLSVFSLADYFRGLWRYL